LTGARSRQKDGYADDAIIALGQALMTNTGLERPATTPVHWHVWLLCDRNYPQPLEAF
jgi:hypothetical protein